MTNIWASYNFGNIEDQSKQSVKTIEKQENKNKKGDDKKSAFQKRQGAASCLTIRIWCTPLMPSATRDIPYCPNISTATAT